MTTLHPRFRAPVLPDSSPVAERVRELEQTIELLGVTLVTSTRRDERAALKARLQATADVAWARSLPKAAETLRNIAEKIPAEDEAPPF